MRIKKQRCSTISKYKDLRGFMRIPWDGGKRVALSPHPNNAVSTSSTDHKVTARRLDDERAKSDLGRQGSGWVINESGLYNVILRSDKPESI